MIGDIENDGVLTMLSILFRRVAWFYEVYNVSSKFEASVEHAVDGGFHSPSVIPVPHF
jgi:hypothetical protein